MSAHVTSLPVGVIVRAVDLNRSNLPKKQLGKMPSNQMGASLYFVAYSMFELIIILSIKSRINTFLTICVSENRGEITKEIVSFQKIKPKLIEPISQTQNT